MEKLHTSTRAVPPQATLARAKAWAAMVGIRSVREITSADSLGLPIFVSERSQPTAYPHAFGKGRLPVESEVGAYMEAIETYFSEPGIASLETRLGLPGELSGVGPGCDPLLEFAPRIDRDSDPEGTLLLVRAEDAETGAAGWVPAELAFNPAPPGLSASLYGVSGNGLASGNSVLEASIHALYELIERDIWSIEFVRNHSVRVAETGLPEAAAEAIADASRGGLRLVIRTVPNDYAIPFFAAFLFDPDKPESRFFNGGWGCHLDRSVALMRAVTEVAQSRAAFRLGLRDAKAPDDSGHETDRLRRQIEIISRRAPEIFFTDIAERLPAPGLEAQWEAVVRCLRRVVDRPIYRLVYTPPEGPLHVVRLIVPRLEHFTGSTNRMGPRMRAELEARASVQTIHAEGRGSACPAGA